MGSLVEQWSGDLDAFGHHVRDPHMLFLDRHLSSCDARHVEEIFHEAGQVTDLAFDDLTLPLQSAAAAKLHQLQRRQNRRQRIPELVPEHREELILGAVGGFRLLPGPLLTLTKLDIPGFKGLPVRDVPRDLRRADDRAFGVPNRRNGQRDVEKTSVLAHPHGLEMLDVFTPNDSREDVLLFTNPLRRYEHRNRLPDGLVRRVSKDPLSPFVPRQDHALQRLADDRVIG